MEIDGQGCLGHGINRLSPQSSPQMIPPRSAGACKSKLMTMLEEGHGDTKVSREEYEELAAWIDLVVPPSPEASPGGPKFAENVALNRDARYEGGPYPRVTASTEFGNQPCYRGLSVINGRKENRGKQYSHYLIFEKSKEFIRQNKHQPFFAYLCWTVPHGTYTLPEDDPSWQVFKDKPWPQSRKEPSGPKAYAAMMHMADRHSSLGARLMQNSFLLITDQNPFSSVL